jgi:hypothetical protein
MRFVAGKQRLCDGLPRRDFLRLGTLGALSSCLSSGVAASAISDRLPGFGRARRCVLLFLTGGPPQHDTFDPKPDAPAEIRGELQPIATRTAGIRFTELFPRLARHTDKLCVVRSVTHTDTVHTSAGYTMLTGAYHPLANTPAGATNVRPTANDNPHFGALLSLTRPARPGVPVFAALPEVIKDAAVNEFPGQGAGFLGHRYDPFRINLDPATSAFEPPPIALPDDMSVQRLSDRRWLNGRIDRAWRLLDQRVGDFTEQQRQAYGLLAAPGLRRAFALDQEPAALRDSYGTHLFGQGCLLARRLLEAGVTLVTVYWHYEGPDDSPVWDTHWNNFRHLRERLAPPTDRAVAALLGDLSARGLLDDTLVICMGEFGRTPRINREAGRDHWGKAQSILLAGAGIRGGRVHGATDRIGSEPADAPVTPPDLVATVLHLLGVNPHFEVHDRTGRPLRAVDGQAVAALLG